MNTIESLRQRVQDYLRDERYRNEQETNYWLMQWKMLALEFDGLFSKAVAKAKEPAMDEVNKVVAEIRERFRIGSALPSYGQMQDWLDRIETALQQPASADVEREARELLAAELRADGDPEYIASMTAESDLYAPAIRAITAALRKQQQEAEPVAAVHSTQDDYEHFLAYSGLPDIPVLRYAYFHGADTGAEKPSVEFGVPISWVRAYAIKDCWQKGKVTVAFPEQSEPDDIPLYTAPQPRIDLGQFREAVEFMRKRASDGMTQHANPRSEADAEAYEKAEADFDRYDSLLDLIAEQEGK